MAFLKKNALTQYQDKLDELGVDTLGVLRSLSDEDVDEIIKECDMKLGHKGLFKSLVTQERDLAQDEKEMATARKEAAKAGLAQMGASDPAAAMAGAALNAQMGGNMDPAMQAMVGGLAANAAKAHAAGALGDLEAQAKEFKNSAPPAGDGNSWGANLAALQNGMNNGGVAGFAAGYVAKRVGMMIMYLVILGFVAVQYAQYKYGIGIPPAYAQQATSMLDQDGDGDIDAEDMKKIWNEKVMPLVAFAAPLGAGFSGGFAVAFVLM